MTLDVQAPPDDLAITADFERVEQVLGNLVDNAFRHTPRGGRIEVGATPARGGLELRVADDGEGIAPEDIRHVFDRFYRGAGETSGSGSGLGLAISREIVRAHGSELRVGSSLVLVEYRKERQRVFGASVEHRLRRTPAGLRVAAKRVDLVNSEAELDGIAFLF